MGCVRLDLSQPVELLGIEEALDRTVVGEAHWKQPWGEVLHPCEVSKVVITTYSQSHYHNLLNGHGPLSYLK